MIGILIITHGNLGESLLECATHVLGAPPQQVEVFAVSKNDDPNQLANSALGLVKMLNTGSGVLVLSDMYGATPCNIVTRLSQPGVVEGVAGINLPMLVRAITYQHGTLDKLVEKAVSGGREGVVYFNGECCERYEQTTLPLSGFEHD